MTEALQSTTAYYQIAKGKKQKFIKIDDIDEIHDMKIFYYIPQAEDIVLCQKSLLTEGAI